MYDSIYMKCPEKVNTYRYKADWWLSEGMGSMRFSHAYEVFCWGDENVLKLDRRDGCQ